MTLLQLEIEGPAAPPRSNGELVFAAPWESRAFGLAAGGEFSYYRCWLEALQTLLDLEGLIDLAAVEDRTAELARRPVGHDHGH
jgi:hypothetical protein